MKAIRILLPALLLLTSVLQAQTVKGLFDKKKKDSTSQAKKLINDIFNTATGASQGGLTTAEVVNGLKQALEVGASRSGEKLSAVDGYFGNALMKILLPPEAQQVEKTLRSLGMGKLVDDAILSMNRAAEDAAKSAAPIFVDAIKGMTVDDGWAILRGSDSAATNYLKGKTVNPLTEAFRPVIDQSLQKTGATKYWNTVFSNYNKVAMKKINPDLPAYVTERALGGLFRQLGDEEKAIRQNPAMRNTDLLKKVFGQSNL